MIMPAQIRAARALLGWNGAELAKAAGVSLQTIRRMESALGPGRSSAANVEGVRRALETAGVIFLHADDASEVGPGVRLKMVSESSSGLSGSNSDQS
ncbi:helix-turn-helix domain-containing protein [Brevundimonas mediterranea]|uniref:helix-turn-helix domain-containing protein n=1 Tax=Brevundimonas mediterranea TaxID=74329 RepID=UPI001606131B